MNLIMLSRMIYLLVDIMMTRLFLHRCQESGLQDHSLSFNSMHGDSSMNG